MGNTNCKRTCQQCGNPIEGPQFYWAFGKIYCYDCGVVMEAKINERERRGDQKTDEHEPPAGG